VRERFAGPSTCTHLNDTMRSLEDVGGLLTALQERVDQVSGDVHPLPDVRTREQP
jgi:hypothetical protein